LVLSPVGAWRRYGARGYDPLHGDRRARLAELTTGDGRASPTRLQAEVERMLDRLELPLQQIKQTEPNPASIGRACVERTAIQQLTAAPSCKPGHDGKRHAASAVSSREG
jgi:hypothetical protein